MDYRSLGIYRNLKQGGVEMEEKILKHRQGGKYNPICKSFADIRSSVVGRQSSVVKPKFVINFTIVELLVVIAILAILAAMLLPALGRAKAVAKQIFCVGNMRQISSGAMCYVNDYNGYIVPWYQNWDGNSNFWFLMLDVGNPSATQSMYTCPSYTKPKTYGYYNTYSINYYLSPRAPLYKYLQINSPSNSIWFSEGAMITDDGGGMNICYFFATTAAVGNNSSKGLNYIHSAQANTLYFDGHVEREKYMIPEIKRRTIINGTWTQ